MEIVLIVIGWFIVQMFGVQKSIAKHKESFSFKYFLKDTWVKVLVALGLSFGIGAGFYFTVNTESAVYEWGVITFNLLNLIYVAIGAVPEFILQQLRKKFGILKTQ